MCFEPTILNPIHEDCVNVLLLYINRANENPKKTIKAFTI